MQYFILSLALMMVMVLAMAVGVIFSNKSLKGSCGGLGAVMGEDCELCDNKDKCKNEKSGNHKSHPKKKSDDDLFSLI